MRSGYLPPFDAWVRDNYWVVVVVTLVGSTGYFALVGRFGELSASHLVVTSGVVVAVGLWLGLRNVDRIYDTIDRLSARGVLEGDPGALKVLMATRARRGALVGGPVVAAVILAIFVERWRLWDRTNIDGVDLWFTTAYATVIAFLAGRAIGRAVVYGTLGLVISRGDWSLLPQRNSPDGASGLAPVGETYFRNSGILLIPAAYFAAYLAAWWIQARQEEKERAAWVEEWAAEYEAEFEFADDFINEPYQLNGWPLRFAVLLILTLLMQFPVFLLPLVSFHSQMQRSCQLWRDEIDETVYPRLARVESELLHCNDQERQDELEKEKSLLLDQCSTVKRCPTWPVDTSIRRRFTVSNVLLLIPLITTALTSESWGEVREAFLEALNALSSQ